MKFGHRILEEAYGLFEDKYISYKELKKAIKLITGNDTSNCTISEVTSTYGGLVGLEGFTHRPPEAQFQDLLNFELDKVNLFSESMFTSLYKGLQAVLQETLQDKAKVSPSVLSRLFTEANDLAEQIVKLHTYVRLNFIGFRKITKKYDKHQETAASCWYLSRILREKFMSLDFDSLVELAASCFAQLGSLRSLDNQLTNDNARKNNLSESHDVRNMTHVTYLVEEDSIMNIRIQLIKAFPLISIGCSKSSLSWSQEGKGSFIAKESSCSSPEKKNCCTLDLCHSGDETTIKEPQESNDPQRFSDNCVLSYATQAPQCQKCKNRSSVSRIYFDNPASLSSYRAGVQSTFEANHQSLRLHWLVPFSDNILEHRDSGQPFFHHNETNELLPIEVIIEFFPTLPIAALPCESWDSFPTLDSATQLKVPRHLAEQLFFKQDFNLECLVDFFDAEQLHHAYEFLSKVIQFTKDNGLFPVVQQWLHRTQLHQPRDLKENTVYITLDENMRFLKLPSLSLLGKNNDLMSCWAPPPLSQPVLDQSGSTSPYGVLTASYSGVQRPDVLGRISGLSTVTEIYHYSPFLHSVAVCFANEISLGSRPEWFNLVRPLIFTDFSSTHYTPTVSKKKMSSAFKRTPLSNQSRILVDVISTKPRDRVVHEHALQLQKTGISTYKIRPNLHEGPPLDHETTQYLQKSSEALPSMLTVPLLSHDTISQRPKPVIKSFFETLKYHISYYFEYFSRYFSTFFLQQRPSQQLEVTKTTVRIEPKTFFANERTLLQWLNAAVLLSTISIALLNFGTSSGRRAGLIIAPIALFFILYSFYIYLVRSYSLERKQPISYNDRFGPSVLVLSLTGALSAVIFLNVTSSSDLQNSP